MNKRGSGSKFGDAEGGDLLAALRNALTASAQPAPPTVPQIDESNLSPEDKALLTAFEKRAPANEPRKRRQKAARTMREIGKLPGKFWREVVGKDDSQTPPPENKIPATPYHYDFGEAAFKKITRLRDRLDGFTAAHGAPALISDSDRSAVFGRVASGAANAARVVNADDGYFIGYDFGTSATKVVLRHPYNPGLPAFIAPVPHTLASHGQPQLWPTAIWFEPSTGRLSPIPEDGWVCLHGFKSAVIEGQGHRTCCGTAVTMRAASAAFLALHTAYVVGAAIERSPKMRLAGMNFAAPVAALKDSKVAAAFENLASAALALIRHADDLTLSQVMAALESSGEAPIPHRFSTELSAAIAGYCSAPRYFQGGHMIVDCGSATLDMASFTLGNEPWPVDIYGASVERLGADSCAKYLENGITSGECVKAVQFQHHSVWKGATARRAGGFVTNTEGQFPYQIILIGGGIDGDIHREVVSTMQPAFLQAFHRPGLANDLELDEQVDTGRFTLADGLARDPIDLREVLMPEDRVQQTVRAGGGLPYGEGFISNDQM